MKHCYVVKNFRASSLKVIDDANTIIDEYQEQGYSLTLRQLYYQMVARGLIPNNVRSYKRIGGILTDARLAGLVDWVAIEDRTRNVRGLSHWAHPRNIVRSAAHSFHFDKWEDQKIRLEVWIEKNALAGVIGPICNDQDISYLACIGYLSVSAVHKASQRLIGYQDKGQYPIILHLGDMDPSGVDMTRDIRDRLEILGLGEHGRDFDVARIALNEDQVKQYDPPPNPAKLTDSRAMGYISKYGYDSWELDALTPQVIVALIEHEIFDRRDDALWKAQVAREEKARAQLVSIYESYPAVIESLNKRSQ